LNLTSWMNAANAPTTDFLDAVVDGHRFHYQKCGSGAPLLLIHGMLGYGFSWRFNMKALGSAATVYAPDLLGMGHSERVRGLDTSLEATADRLFGFMDKVGIKQADLLGTSHGGSLAMWMAATRPERVRRLILVAPANPFCNVSDPLIRFWQSPLGKWFGMKVPFLPRPLQELCLARMYGSAECVANGTLDGYVEPLRIPGTPEHVLKLLAGWHDDMAALRERLNDLPEVPTLLMWGDRDRAVGLKSCALLRKYMPLSRLVVMRGAGHLTYEERPEEFNKEVVTFLENSAAASRKILSWRTRQSSAA